MGKQQISSLKIALFYLFFLPHITCSTLSFAASPSTHFISFSTISCLSTLKYFIAVFYESVKILKLGKCFIHVRASLSVFYSHHTCCLLLPAAPGPGGDLWSFSHPALCHCGISWDGAVDQRRPCVGWGERPPRYYSNRSPPPTHTHIYIPGPFIKPSLSNT